MVREKMLPVSVVLVTKNEENNIREALQSIRDASEIIIVDDFSTDKTVEICREFTEKVFQIEWKGYAAQKQKAIDLAEGPWVFLLDADERFTESLAEEVKRIGAQKGEYAGFFVPRKNFFLGKWIRHGAWWPDYTLRLFKKEAAQVEARKVHEKVIVRGKAGFLENPLEHFTYRTVSDYLKKMEVYSTLAAEELKDKGKRSGIMTMCIHSAFTFWKMYFFRLGFLDGIHGFVLAVLYSYYTFLKYLKLWEASGDKP
jgi:glycosyltransferase involved in cell wall biosynthesis